MTFSPHEPQTNKEERHTYPSKHATDTGWENAREEKKVCVVEGGDVVTQDNDNSGVAPRVILTTSTSASCTFPAKYHRKPL